MKSSIIAMSVAALLAFGVASAATSTAAPAAAAPAKTLTPQQQKMAACSTANKGKTGDAYKAAQKACLSSKSAPAAAAPVAAAAPAAAPAAAAAPATATKGNTKMGACATANKGKKGADYKAGMSACMKKAA